MKLDSNFSGFSVNSASFKNHVENGEQQEGKKSSGAGGTKRACCGRGCCSQGKQKIAIGDLSNLLKKHEHSDSNQGDKKEVHSHSRHIGRHFQMDLPQQQPQEASKDAKVV